MLSKFGGGGLARVMHDIGFPKPDETNFMTGPGSTRVLVGQVAYNSAMKVLETQRENG